MAVFPSSRPNISLRVLPKIPATLTAVGGIGITKSNGVWTISPRFTDLQLLTPSIMLDPSTKEIWIHDPVTDVYNRMTLGGLGQALWWGTSSTSLPITTGPAMFTTESGKDWLPGMYVQAVSASSASNFMAGQVSSYVGTSLTLNVGTTSGFGSHADWTLIPTGVPGTGGGGGLGTPLAVNIQTFPASGTYTPSPGMSYVIVECIGGGGGGGGTIVGADVSWGGGGGSGGYSRKFVSATDVGASQPVTVGTPGAAGVPAGNGGAGGDSSFGTFCIGKGGQGGAGFNATSSTLGLLTGLGGVVGTGDVKAGGAPGDKSGAGTPIGGSTAVGGSSALGGGGGQNIPGANQGFAGLDALNYGSGGGGGIQSAAPTAVGGGAGSAGVVIVTEFIGGTGGGGGGSGTVNSGTAGQLAIYPSTGTTVNGATAAQATAALNVFTATLKGVAPLSGGGAVNFLRADGTWAAPAGGGSGTVGAGTLNQIAFYGAAGTAVQGETLLQAVNMPALTGDVTNTAGTLATTIAANAVTNAKMATMPTLTFKGNATGITAVPTDMTVATAWTTLGVEPAANSPAFTGDVTKPSGSLAQTIAASAVTNAKMANMVTATIKGNNSGSTGAPLDLTTAQVTAMLNVVTTALAGLAPASGGGTTNFLRADATWAAPAGGGGVNAGTINQLAYYAAAGSTVSGETLLQAVNHPALTGDVTCTAGTLATVIGGHTVTNPKLSQAIANSFKGNPTGALADVQDMTATVATALLNIFTTALQGLVPASGGGTTNFLRADGAWSTPGIPINNQSAAYTAVLADANTAITHPTTDNTARTFTIPANASVAYPVGTTLTFVNMINTLTISIITDTMTLAGAGTTGSRTLAANGIATALKLTSTTWLISGTGLT